jgi:hypothetical protein
MSARIPINPKIHESPPVQAELPVIVVPASAPPTSELVTKAQLVARHPHLLRLNRVVWALRRRAVNGSAAAVFDSPCGELLIHEPSFLAWLLGLSGRSKPRAGRRGGCEPSRSPASIRIVRGPGERLGPPATVLRIPAIVNSKSTRW